MIEDERGPQSIADDIRSQGAQRLPKQIDLHVWAIIVLIIAVLIIFMI
jgi:hypothetical protein